jgi:hypothetical protein
LSYQFDEFAAQVEEIVQTNMEACINVYEQWSLRISASVSRDETTRWPFVTLPDFEAQGDSVAHQTGNSRQISFHPLIESSQQSKWEDFVVQNHQGWMQESYDYNMDYTKAPPLVNAFINQGKDKPEKAEAPIMDGIDYYTPYWQVAPLMGSEHLINFDALAFDFAQPVLQQLLSQRNKNQTSVLSQPINLTPLRGGPESLLVVPIVEISKTNNTLVAVLLATVSWEQYFSHIVPVGRISFVVRSACEAVPDITFHVNGPDEVEFVGETGDFHEQQYSSLGVEL